MKTSDWVVLGLLVAMAVVYVPLAATVENYGRDTTSYLLLARSLLSGDGYRLNFEAHTVYPPGYPLVLAALMWAGVGSWSGLVRATIPIYFLGLFGGYLLLRSLKGRRTAAIATLLTGSSTAAFLWTTVGLHSEIVYFTCSVAALLSMDAARRVRSPLARAGLVGAGTLCISSLPMIRTIGVAMPIGIGLWIGLSLIRRSAPALESFRTRVTRWGPAVALATAVTAGWMAWGSAHKGSSRDYEAFMGSYVSQMLKSDPHELGSRNIGFSDIPGRLVTIAATRGLRTTQTLLNVPYRDLSKKNPLVLLVVLAVTIGFLRSAAAGVTALDCYVLVYAAILLTWPFDEGNRFMFPILPFLFVYGIEGVQTLWRGAESVLRLRWMPGERATRLLAGAVLLVIVGAGAYASAQVARDNLHPDPTSFRVYPTVEAAEWVRGHTAPGAIIMADANIIMHRLTGRRVFRFPLIVDPARTLELINEAKVDYLVILREQKYEYFNPSTSHRFRQVMELTPGEFRLVYEFDAGSIYVRRKSDGRPSAS